MSLTDLFRQYLGHVGEKISSPDFTLHPMVKAFMLATKEAQDGKKDGNYMGLSGDADLEPDKKPRILISVIVSKMKNDITVMEIANHSSNTRIPFSMAEKIIRSELMIEGFTSQEIPIRDAAEIIADSIDKRARILYDGSEIMEAVRFAQQQIRAGIVEDVDIDVDVIGEILSLKGIDEWYKLSNAARAFIATIWADRTGNELVITTLEPTLPKWRLKVEIMRLLTCQFAGRL